MYVPEELCKWPFPMEGMHQVALAQRASTDGCKGTIVTRNHGFVRQKKRWANGSHGPFVVDLPTRPMENVDCPHPDGTTSPRAQGGAA